MKNKVNKKSGKRGNKEKRKHTGPKKNKLFNTGKLICISCQLTFKKTDIPHQTESPSLWVKYSILNSSTSDYTTNQNTCSTGPIVAIGFGVCMVKTCSLLANTIF